jgi:hypothetical protein
MLVCCCSLAGTPACRNCLVYKQQMAEDAWTVKPEVTYPSYTGTYPQPVPMGWKCPECGRINNPNVPSCPCGGKGREDG